MAAVDLKDLVLAVPLVILDVKVGEAHVADVLQKGPDLLRDLPAGLGEDHRVVADAVGGVLLQEHMAHAHELDFAVAVGIVGEHPHVAVVPGDEVLDNHGVWITGGIDLVQHLLQALPVGAGEYLFIPRERVLPIGHPVGGLADVGGLEVQGKVVAHLPAVDEGAGVVDAVPVAQLVKGLLVDKGVDERSAHRGGHAVGGEGILVLRRQLYIAVPAAMTSTVLPANSAATSATFLRNVAASSFWGQTR